MSLDFWGRASIVGALSFFRGIAMIPFSLTDEFNVLLALGGCKRVMGRLDWDRDRAVMTVLNGWMSGCHD